MVARIERLECGTSTNRYGRMAVDVILSKGDRLPDVNRAAHYRAAIIAQVVLLAYFELCILIPLGRWNDQPGISVEILGSGQTGRTQGRAES